MPLEWIHSRFGSSVVAKLGPDMVLHVSYESVHRLPPDDPHYNVTVFGVRQAERVATQEEGKRVAEGLAREVLRGALAKLED